MNDDTIKLLNLEHIEHLIESIETVSSHQMIALHLRLFKAPQTCPSCSHITERFHSYRMSNHTQCTSR